MRDFLDFLKILGQLNLFHGLVLEMLKNSKIFYELKDFFTIKIFFEFFFSCPRLLQNPLLPRQMLVKALKRSVLFLIPPRSLDIYPIQNSVYLLKNKLNTDSLKNNITK